MNSRRVSTHPGSTSPSLAQPESTHVAGSNFEDSAVDMDATTNLHETSDGIKNLDKPPARTPSSTPHSISDRLRRLAASAWTLEQDDDLPEQTRCAVERRLASLEAIIEDDVRSVADSTQSDSTTEHRNSDVVTEHGTRPEEVQDQDVDVLQLSEVHDNLTKLVASMRLRQEEQRHLHQLTATKIEAVAARCLLQEQQIRDMVKEVKSLRTENQILGQDNDRLRETVTGLESEASAREVAVSAMTSAVAGLEGWIDDADKTPIKHETPRTTREHRQSRSVIRGKGRFRGRYYLEDDHNRFDSRSPDARDLQDGVKAWIRGFRDVEDACSSPGRGRAKELYRGGPDGHEDDWGDFESPVITPP